MRTKTYQVWVKFISSDQWQCLYTSDDPVMCRDYAENNIHHGSPVQRIELRDGFGSETLETIYSKQWRA